MAQIALPGEEFRHHANALQTPPMISQLGLKKSSMNTPSLKVVPYSFDSSNMASVDEQQPLLRPVVESIGNDVEQNEIVLDFEAGDPENPREWAASYQWTIVLLLASMAFAVYVIDSKF
jgi:hypothetical protein